MRHAPLAGILAGAALIAVPATAAANQAGAVACDRATATFTGYPTQEVHGLLELVADGQPLTVNPVSFTGPIGTAELRYTLTATHSLELYWTRTGPGFGRRVLIATATVECGPTTPPTPTPPEVTPPPAQEPPPEPRKAPTCGDLRDAYPLAGKARLIAWGCATPNPPKAKPPREPRRPRPRPRVVTCSFVLSHYSGAPRARMILRHRLPATCGRPFNPPVAG